MDYRRKLNPPHFVADFFYSEKEFRELYQNRNMGGVKNFDSYTFSIHLLFKNTMILVKRQELVLIL
jgi:hypothetical protein